MPRIRTLKPEHRQHRKVGPLSHVAYRLWVGMILEADDEGRLICSVDHLRVVIFGYHAKVTAAMVRGAIQELEATGLICTYANGAIGYAAFPSWKDHQKIDHPTASVLPAPGEEDRPYRKIRIPDAVRREVATRYGAVEGVPLVVKCHYCRETEGGIHVFSSTGWVAFAELELDHVIPEYRGGASTADNIVLACRNCNRSKGSRMFASDSRTLANVSGGSEGREGSEGSEGSEGKERRAREDSRASGAQLILEFLNHKAGRNYQPTPINLGFIRARLKDGATLAQCRAIIGNKTAQWKGDAKMNPFLRPATLFNETKFAQYLGELPATAFQEDPDA